jgi:tyrosyl-tRNA synthetase
LNDVLIEDDKLAIGSANLLPEGVIKLSVGKKRHTLLRPI